MIFIFLTSGLFLGWSLGANDAANIFGTAVGTKMVRFKTAAVIASIFVIIGAVVGGSGAAHTLGKLGAVNALAGSFTVALSAALTVFGMTKFKLPVSSSQAIVGAIIGWNFFTSSVTEYSSLIKIISTWIICPVLAAVFSMLLYMLARFFINHSKIHLLRVDMRTRLGLIAVGAFGAYSLGANNIANVMGVFVPASPFSSITLFNLFTLSGAQILFLIGGIAIGFGILTYSYKVMETVGGSLLRLTPIAALIVVLSESLVLFLFSSQALEQWLFNHNLPTIPLVPVSSSQAVVGAVIGIGLLKGGRGIRYKVLAEIGTGWISTPVIACIITFVALFFVKNVFDQKVSQNIEYRISEAVLEKISSEGIGTEQLLPLKDKIFINPLRLKSAIRNQTKFEDQQINKIYKLAEINSIYVDPAILSTQLDPLFLSESQIISLKKLIGKKYDYTWQFIDNLIKNDSGWGLKEGTRGNKQFNEKVLEQREYVINLFRIKASETENY
jgi:PiT family inorganic phosphate transporter